MKGSCDCIVVGREVSHMPIAIETKVNMTHHFSSLIIKQVSRLKQNGLNNRQIADDILIPISEVEEILAMA